jgi:7,8-dihydro-6-hydroxymethylpterin-pyrophosphokinase
VVELPTALTLNGLIAELHDVEAQCGRGRDDPKWAPRAMDLDLLLDGARVETTAEYRLPRPDLLKRPYMLLPLAELAGGLVHPTEHASIAALAARWLQEPANAQAAAAMQRMALDLNSV